MSRSPKPSFASIPRSWSWFIDESLFPWIKAKYSPKDAWKNKPFSEMDAHFFLKGIRELSDLFIEEHDKKLPLYLNHPKYRSSYLLYWFPLQSAKFCSLFALFPKAIEAALQHGITHSEMKILDLGSGPGTASIAFLLYLLDPKISKDQIPNKIKIHLIDQNESILHDGKEMVDLLCNQYPKLKGKVEVQVSQSDWRHWGKQNWKEESSIVFLGHVLNEDLGGFDSQTFAPYLQRLKGGGMLLMEPAAKHSSQKLSQLRDQLFENEQITSTPQSIWGPCLHAGACPLSVGRDWCHFSIPAQLPSQWFTYLSKGLNTEKEWLKYSYLWIAAQGALSPLPQKNIRRVVSDPIPGKTRKLPDLVLLCEPETTRRHSLKKGERLWRGDVVKI